MHISLSLCGGMSWLCDASCQRQLQAKTSFNTVTTVFYLSLSSLAVSPCCYCLAFTIGSFSPVQPLILCFSNSVPESTEGIRQWPRYSRHSPAVQAVTAETAAPMCGGLPPPTPPPGTPEGGWWHACKLFQSESACQLLVSDILIYSCAHKFEEIMIS